MAKYFDRAVHDLTQEAVEEKPNFRVEFSQGWVPAINEPENYLPMPVHVASRIKSLSDSSPGKEVCGLILAKGGNERNEWRVVQITNRSESSAEFIMDQDELLSIFQDQFDDVIGTFHSHLSGRPEPSGQDILYAQTQWRYFIVAKGSVYEWRIERQDRMQVEVSLLGVV